MQMLHCIHSGMFYFKNKVKRYIQKEGEKKKHRKMTTKWKWHQLNMPMREPLTRLSDQQTVASCCKQNLLLLFGLADRLLMSKDNSVLFSKICQEPIIQLHLQEYVSPSEPKLSIQVPSRGNTDISAALDEPNSEVMLYLWSVKRKGKFYRERKRKGDPKSI